MMCIFAMKIRKTVKDMHIRFFLLVAFMLTSISMNGAKKMPFAGGWLTVTNVARNAVRIQFSDGSTTQDPLPDWLYVRHDDLKKNDVKVDVDAKNQMVRVKNKKGQPLPNTGGPGTVMFMIAGALLIVLAIGGLILTTVKKRRASDTEH